MEEHIVEEIKVITPVENIANMTEELSRLRKENARLKEAGGNLDVVYQKGYADGKETMRKENTEMREAIMEMCRINCNRENTSGDCHVLFNRKKCRLACPLRSYRSE